MWTERGKMVDTKLNTTSPYTGITEQVGVAVYVEVLFKYRPGNLLSRLRLLVALLFQGSGGRVPQLHCDRFLPNSVQVIIHPTTGHYIVLTLPAQSNTQQDMSYSSALKIDAVGPSETSIAYYIPDYKASHPR
jgi:hypothetical protein